MSSDITSTAPPPVPHGSYVLGEAADLTRTQLGYLSELFDPPTRTFLTGLGLPPDARCLDVGAGNGSVSAWLADQVAQQGQVVAVDLDTQHLAEYPGVRVLRHDILDGAPAGGPYDLIFARGVLVHLPTREEVLCTLADALAPGGWLVLAEPNKWGVDPDEVLAVPKPGDQDLYHRISMIATETLLPAAGLDQLWCRRADAAMQRAGLIGLHGMEYSVTMTGGTTAGLLNQNYFRQVRAPLLAYGATEDELARFDALMSDPQFRARFVRLTFTAGRRRR